MDNLTHSLVGAAIAQGAIQYRQLRGAESSSGGEVSPAIAALPMYVVSILANNFPDLDLLITAFMDPRLGYILHHRGHTHTLLFVPVQWAMLLGLLWLYQRWRGADWSGEDWRWFAALAFAGGCVHLAMDSWNVYGVHPFWPLDNNWYYGDFVFIVEPLFWIVLIPWLYCGVHSRWSRRFLLFCYSLGMVAIWVVYIGFWWYPLGLCAAGLAFGAWQRRQRHRPQVQGLATAVAFVVVVGGLLASSLWLRGELRRALQRQAPDEEVLDIALMSYPANPFCYQWISVAHQKQGDIYSLRKGLFSFSPRIFACPILSHTQTAPLQVSASKVSLGWGGTIGPQKAFRRSLRELRRWAGHCKVEAALQFIRAPYWQGSKASLLLGDVRFDRRKAFDLADFRFGARAGRCPPWLPPWIPPLRKLGLWPQKAPNKRPPPPARGTSPPRQ